MRNFDMGEAWSINIAMLKDDGVTVTLIVLATMVPFFAFLFYPFSDFYLLVPGAIYRALVDDGPETPTDSR